MVLYEKLKVRYGADLGKMLPARLCHKIENEKGFCRR